MKYAQLWCASLSIILSFVFNSLAYADQKNTGNTKPVAKQALSQKEDPTLIGKRNINKHQIDFYSQQKEAAIGAQLAAQIAQKVQFVTDPVVTEYVNRVAQNIGLHSDIRTAITVRVIDSEDVNAFALPGGYLFVNKGLLLAVDNEAELAGVMAHELGHVAARHGVEQASKKQLIDISLTAGSVLLSGGMAGPAARAASSIFVPAGYMKFGRDAENEADMLGAEYLWACGYDPGALPSFFQKLEGKEKKKPGTIAKLFSDHPQTADRRARVSALIARFPTREEYIVTTSEFNRVKEHLISLSAVPQHVGDSRDSGQPQRPTLKRGRPTDPGGQDPMQPNTQPPDDKQDTRPTLKRNPGNVDPNKQP